MATTMTEDTRTGAATDPTPEATTTEAPEASETPAGAPSPEADVAAFEAEIAKLRDQGLRALAEAENVRRRGERERDDAARFAITGFAQALLDVADNLSQALAVPPGGEAQALRQGVELTERTLLAVFERFGISRIDALGQAFDPHRHQAIFEVEADRPDGTVVPGTVVQVLRAGYMLNGRLLRPAMVAVAKGGTPAGVDTSA